MKSVIAIALFIVITSCSDQGEEVLPVRPIEKSAHKLTLQQKLDSANHATAVKFLKEYQK